MAHTPGGRGRFTMPPPVPPLDAAHRESRGDGTGAPVVRHRDRLRWSRSVLPTCTWVDGRAPPGRGGSRSSRLSGAEEPLQGAPQHPRNDYQEDQFHQVGEETSHTFQTTSTAGGMPQRVWGADRSDRGGSLGYSSDNRNSSMARLCFSFSSASFMFSITSSLAFRVRSSFRRVMSSFLR